MAQKRIVVLFSGGADSTSVAVHYLKNGYHAHLITFDNGAQRWLSLSKYKGKSIEMQFPESCVYGLLDCTKLFRELAIRNLEEDVRRYGNLVCCGCKLAMLAEAILYCKKNGIAEIADGFKKEQDYYPEQTPEYMDMADEFARRHGISYRHPLYETGDEVPDEPEDGEYIPVPPMQASCLFGENPITDRQFIEAYVRSKLPAMRKYIEGVLSPSS